MNILSRIMLVDKDVEYPSSSSSRLILARLEYHLIPHPSKQEPIEMLRCFSDHVDLILAECKVWHINGSSFPIEVKKTRLHMPVIIYFANGCEFAIDWAKKPKADFITLKPYRFKDFHLLLSWELRDGKIQSCWLMIRRSSCTGCYEELMDN